jgi:uncharacterized PurR-regulated membrane protein YhhQ (DUF165 family)
MFYAIGYLLTIVLANWAIQRFGLVPVGFGLLAPAGVYFAGLAFTLRDLTQEALGRWWCVVAIVAGAGLSFLLGDGRIAAASGAAFLLSELADFAVYQPLRERRWLLAVFASGVVGAALDSALFLALAFGSLDFWLGQFVGKFWITLAFVAILWGVRRVVSQRRGERGYAHVGD